MVTLSALLAAVTRRALLRSLRLSRGSRVAAAAALGVSPRTFQRLLAQHAPPEELAAMTRREGWPSRVELAAHAREARARRT